MFMEHVGFIRNGAWKNARFGSIRDIWDHIVTTEPRHDPTVFPIEDDTGETEPKTTALSEPEVQPTGEYKPARKSSTFPNTAAFYRSQYLSGKLTPLDVAQAILPLIRRDTSPPGEHSVAWIEVHAELVLQAAEASTLRYKEKRSLGPLDGVPTAVKDEFDMLGYRTSLGTCHDYAEFTESGPGVQGHEDEVSWCVKKLEEAGAVILGKLSLHEFGMGQNLSGTAAVRGPIAADMRSLIALYEVTSVPDPQSYFPPAKPFNFDSHSSSPKVLGVPSSWVSRADPEVQKICQDLIDRLVKHKGYTVVPIDIPFVAEGQIAHAITLLGDAASLVQSTAGISPANRILLALGRTTPAWDYLLAQKLRRVLMQHLAWLWQQHPGMIMVTPTSASAGWPIRSEKELKYGISDGDQTMRTMEYVWLANFCGVPSITVPAGFATAEGKAGAEAPPSVPVGLMGTGEWCSEEALLRFGLDAEDVGHDILHHPSNWVDVAHLARQERERIGNVRETNGSVTTDGDDVPLTA
ncbi:hypothetical protein ACHAQA_003618 [Verticillium albo-atrum]